MVTAQDTARLFNGTNDGDLDDADTGCGCRENQVCGTGPEHQWGRNCNCPEGAVLCCAVLW